jgi:hypothetical protein
MRNRATILARLLRRPANACAICDLYSGHDNAAHDRHLASRVGTPIPVDGKPAPTPQAASCVVCRTNGSVGSRKQWTEHMEHTFADEAARYWREVHDMNTYLAATAKEETA